MSLQKKTKDVIQSYSEIEATAAALSDTRSNIERIFPTWFEEATRMAQSVQEEMVMPRTAGRQTLRQNQPPDMLRHTSDAPQQFLSWNIW